MLLSFAAPKDPGVSKWLYVPSLLVAWVGYLAYEGIYIPSHCRGECNIRVDLLIIYPYLAFVTICAIAYFLRASPATRRRR